MNFEVLQDEIVAFARQLVRIESKSGQEGEVAEAVQKKMLDLGFDEVRTDKNGSVTGRRSGGRPGARILFDGHMDVIPAENAGDWSVNPFGGDLQGGKIWGRGASDMKGSLAAMVVTLGRLERADFAGEILVSASVGEEMIEGAALQTVMDAWKPDGVVIGEPSDCRIGYGQKGRAGFWLDVTGKPAHTSNPALGENAIYKAMAMTQAIRAVQMPHSDELGDGVVELIEIVSRPFPGECTVPYGCRLRYDVRLVQGETPGQIQNMISQCLSNFADWRMDFNDVRMATFTGGEITQPEYHPSWLMEKESPWIRLAAQGLLSAGIEPEYFVAPYCTNGSYSGGVAKVPTLIFGPSSVRLAHIVDEYIEVDELMRGAKGFVGLAANLGALLPDLST